MGQKQSSSGPPKPETCTPVAVTSTTTTSRQVLPNDSLIEKRGQVLCIRSAPILSHPVERPSSVSPPRPPPSPSHVKGKESPHVKGKESPHVKVKESPQMLAVGRTTASSRCAVQFSDNRSRYQDRPSSISFTPQRVATPRIKVDVGGKKIFINQDGSVSDTIVYLDRSLQVGDKIWLQVKSVRGVSHMDIGFVLGFATIDHSETTRHMYPHSTYCEEDTLCEGFCARDVVRINTRINTQITVLEVERVDKKLPDGSLMTAQIRKHFSAGHTTQFLAINMPCRFEGAELYPFINLNGRVVEVQLLDSLPDGLLPADYSGNRRNQDGSDATTMTDTMSVSGPSSSSAAITTNMIKSRPPSPSSIPLNFSRQSLTIPGVKVVGMTAKLDVGSSNSIVYFNRGIKVGEKIVLKVDSFKPDSRNFHHSFTLGFTSCWATSVPSNPSHYSKYCRSNKSCHGKDIFERIRTSKNGDVHVLIRRLDRTQFTVAVTIFNATSQSMIEIKGQKHGNKYMFGGDSTSSDVLPFIDFDGFVSGLAVMDEIPNCLTATSCTADSASTPNNDQLDSWKFFPQFMELKGEQFVRKGNDPFFKPYYLIGRNPIKVKETLTFTITGVKDMHRGDNSSLAFGVTTNDPNDFTLEGLPGNPYELMNEYRDHCFVVDNLCPGAVYLDIFQLKRHQSSITVKNVSPTSGDWTKEREVLTVEGDRVMYPFFLLAGKVNSIHQHQRPMSSAIQRDGHEATHVVAAVSTSKSEKKTNKKTSSKNDKKMKGNMADKNSSSCIACKDSPANHILVPCGHVVYCDGCLKHSTNECPVCRKDVQRVMKIFL